MEIERKYIGGDFCEADNIKFYSAKGRHSSFDYYFPKTFNSLNRFTFETGSDALGSFLSMIPSENLTLLVPKLYCFESIDRSIYKSGKKVEVKTYLNFDELLYLKNRYNQKNTILILNHYNTYSPVLFAQCLEEVVDDRKFLIVEDFVHCPFDIRHSHADFSFNSLRKIGSLNVSVAYSKENMNASIARSNYLNTYLDASTIKSNFLTQQFSDFDENFYLNKYKEAEKQLRCKKIYFANTTERNKAERVDFELLLEKRKNNYSYVKSQLEAIEKYEFLNGEYMFLIVKIDERDKLRRHLFSHNIFPPIHWLDSKDPICNRLLSIPVDQRYSKEDLARVITTLKVFCE